MNHKITTFCKSYKGQDLMAEKYKILTINALVDIVIADFFL